jgi:NurA-like 5'-3' nuclease
MTCDSKINLLTNILIKIIKKYVANTIEMLKILTKLNIFLEKKNHLDLIHGDFLCDPTQQTL